MDIISIIYTIYNEKDIEDAFVHEKLIKLCLMANASMAAAGKTGMESTGVA